ncbi:hypothetical protein DSO57_1031725 [Entomophthora muscae]|uniref:Uncharacterized protein n=1 Tax=Entomophthora muscae TaxID=34485 RepID=A0ACC2SDF2_9FUNG|nr:hypothetical protein DSO57_1031725 [Entomophthora muscae]
MSTIHELPATTPSPASLEAAPWPDSQAARPAENAAALQRKAAAQHTAATEAVYFPETSKGNSCYPGLPGQPYVYIADGMIALTKEVSELNKGHAVFNKGFQKLDELVLYR